MKQLAFDFKWITEGISAMATFPPEESSCALTVSTTILLVHYTGSTGTSNVCRDMSSWFLLPVLMEHLSSLSGDASVFQDFE